MRIYISLLLLASLGAISCQKPSTPNSALEKIKLSKIASEDIFNLAKLDAQKLTLINFWATWCGPCRKEFPDLLKFRTDFQTKGVAFHFVTVDFEGDIADAKTFLMEQNVNFLTYIKTGDDEAFINTIDKKWSGALPTTFVLDAGGRILHRFDGPVSYSDLESKVNQFLKTSEVKGKKL